MTASRIPRLDTIENMMRVSQMVVQAVWETKSSLLQLPHVTEDMLRHFVTKKVWPVAAYVIRVLQIL